MANHMVKKYYFDNIGFSIHCDSEELLVQVDQYLSPHFYEVSDLCIENWDIDYMQGDLEYSHYDEKKNIGVFGEGSHVEANVSNKDGIYRYINIESNNETIIDFIQKKARVIYTGKEFDLNLLEDCYALLRTICYHYLGKRNAMVFHGCALRYKNKTILLLGDKGVGKTTIQHYLLQEMGADFISADRTMVWLSQMSFLCAGWISTYRPEVGIFELLKSSPKITPLYQYYLSKRNDPLYFQKNKIRISPGKLAELLNIKTLPTSTLDIVIFVTGPNEIPQYFIQTETDTQKIECLCKKHILEFAKMGVTLPEHGGEENGIDMLPLFLKGQTKFYSLSGRGQIADIKQIFDKICNGERK